jgi:4,5:9,10-diseco-3-hydroxy-5,9,17-trioxoandrosta-1(10),2-diene-4-oate hydrolase
VSAVPVSLFVDAGGIKTHAYVAGAGDGLPAVFVHGGGLGSSARSWLGTMQEIGRKRLTFAADTVGFGLTDAPAIAYHTQRILDHLAAFLDAFCLERVILTGHSLGSTIVARFTVEHPERVAACVMVAPGGGALGISYHSDGQDAMARVLADPSPANVHALSALMRATDDGADADATARLALATRPGHLEALRAYAAASPAPTLLERLPKSTVPLMLMWGLRERFNPPEIGDHIAQKLPNLTRYVVFEQSGHYIQHDEPTRFYDTLNDFFDRVEVAS